MGEEGGRPGADAWEPKIIAFICNWCSYVGADLAGTSRLRYPENVRIIRVPCSGRIDPVFVIRSFQRGADGVLISGCHPGDCHYGKGNYYARRRGLMLRKLLEFTGLDPCRIQMSWVSASEGAKWAAIIADMTEQIRELGPVAYADRSHSPLVGGRKGENGGDGDSKELDRSTAVHLPRVKLDVPCESIDTQPSREPASVHDRGR
ncbi:MAG: hydrogenase iron-sulfur subunit [Chloroflexi bacterium]|nr:hydrogenase iron-sulfur subunit [Chloroflexota bacterium]